MVNYLSHAGENITKQALLGLFGLRTKPYSMTDVTIHLSPVVTEDLLCPSILVSGAGTSDGLYKIAPDQRTAWAPGRQVYEHIDGDRYFCFALQIMRQ